VNPSQGASVLLDPSNEVADTLLAVEDWLLGDPDPHGDVEAIDRAAEVAGALSWSLRKTARTAPELFSPDGHLQLSPVLAIEADLGALVVDVHRAIRALPDEQPPPDTFRVLGLLDRCELCSRTEDGAVLVAAARSGPGALRLDARQYRAYQRFARVVLVDPLDRFIAVGFSPAVEPDSAAHLSPEGPEVGL